VMSVVLLNDMRDNSSGQKRKIKKQMHVALQRL
jgi:hypothetical protein